MELNSLYAQMQETARVERSERDARLAEMRPRLLAELRAVGVTEARFTYDGGNDDGSVQMAAELSAALGERTMQARGQTWDAAKRAYVMGDYETAVADALLDFMSDTLTAHVGNWWDGDIETYGDMTWDVSADRIASEGSRALKDYQSDSFDERDDDESGEDA